MLERGPRLGELSGLEERDTVVIPQQWHPLRAGRVAGQLPLVLIAGLLECFSGLLRLVLLAEQRRERDVGERRDRRLLKRVVGELPQRVDCVPLVALKGKHLCPFQMRGADER